MLPVSVIIATWNAKKFTEKCIDLLLNCKSSIDEVIIIDNGSKDGTVEYLNKLQKKHKEWIKTHFYDENKGFVAAINKGIKIKKEKNDILITNNDVEIRNPKLIKALQEKAYSLENCAAIHPKQMSTTNDFLCGPSFTLPVTKIGYSYGDEPNINQFIDDVETEIVMFACCYIKAEALDKIGLLDDNIFSYAEDSDWCTRAHQMDYKIWHASSLEVTHHHNISCKENDVDVGSMQKKSVLYFADKHKDYFEDRYAGNVMIQGCTGYPSGYSKMTEQIIRKLEEDPNPIKVKYGFIYGISNYEPESESRYVNEITRLRNPRRGGIQILIGQGDVFYKNSGKYAIGYSMMDCDKWPKWWVEQANDMDELFVPTNYGKEVMIDSGIKKPITVVPLGVDPNYYHPDIIPIHEKQFVKFRRDLNFISIFEWGERKQPLMLIEAWHKAFHDNPDVALFIKFINSDPSLQIKKQIAKVVEKHPQSKAVVVFMTHHDYNGYSIESNMMPSLIAAHDAFVWTSASEGFGLPPLESLACGLPVGITGKFGYLPENIDMPGVTMFDYEMEKVTPEICRCEYYWGANWAKPKIDDVIEKLRYMVENISFLKKQALLSSKKIRKDLTWAKTTSIIKERIFRIQKDMEV